MREPPLSTAEKHFLLQSFLDNYRLDGRAANDYRQLDIQLGAEPGQCLVQLGNTKCFAQVSCELKEPKETRPSDGTLFISVTMSNMAAPQYEFGKSNDTGIELCRLLERIVKESQCVDTESLCVKAGLVAWQIRVDVHVLDDDGSLVDCASTAAVTALAHFRRPDCTVTNESVIVHPASERAPIPLNLYHYPVCMTFGYSEKGACMIVDPTDRERQVLDGCVVVGANKRKEICALHATGSLILDKSQMLTVCSRAIQRASYVSERMQAALVEQRQIISRKEPHGLTCSFFLPSHRMPTSFTNSADLISGMASHASTSEDQKPDLNKSAVDHGISSQGSVARLSNSVTTTTTNDNESTPSHLLRQRKSGRVPQVDLTNEEDDDDDVEMMERELTRANINTNATKTGSNVAHIKTEPTASQSVTTPSKRASDDEACNGEDIKTVKKKFRKPKPANDLDDLFGEIEADVHTLDSEFGGTELSNNQAQTVTQSETPSQGVNLMAAIKTKKKKK